MWKYISLLTEERGAASYWISCSRIPAASVIGSEPHLDRILFWLLIAGPDLRDSSGYVTKTDFKRGCVQRLHFHLLRKTFYLILLIMYVPNHSSIPYGSGIARGRRCLNLFFWFGLNLFTFLLFQSGLVFLPKKQLFYSCTYLKIGCVKLQDTVRGIASADWDHSFTSECEGFLWYQIAFGG